MSTTDKKETLRNEIKIICEIAIEAFQKFKPNDLNHEQLNLIIKAYNRFIDEANKYNSIRDLESLKKEALTYFLESPAGTDNVEYFWNHERIVQLAIPRVNPLERILKKKKITKHEDYVYITDILVAAWQEGHITEEQFFRLGKMADDYMMK